VELGEFSLRKASLDEVFLALTGDRADGGSRDGSGRRDDSGPLDDNDDVRELDELERCSR